MAASARVKGHCPACGQDGLMVVSGSLLCTAVGCPMPTAAARLLEDRETQHVVTVTEDGRWTIRHPLYERIGRLLTTCDLTAVLHASTPLAPATYRAVPLPGGWMFEHPETHDHDVFVPAERAGGRG